MNIILKLLDPDFVHQFFTERLLPRYPAFAAVSDIKINPIKKHVWQSTYHVVFEFTTTLRTRSGRTLTLPIYASAHSSEPRKNVYDGIKFLWDHGFYRGKLTIPRPLFYSNQFKATFYRGVVGDNLYHFIREGRRGEVEQIVPKAAGLFAKLHSLPTAGARNFNRKNSRIETAIPGKSHIISRIKSHFPQYYQAYKLIYHRLVAVENDFLSRTEQRWLVHGDAHPENIIKVSQNKTGLIDFTDLCLSDFARDLGTFLQQLEFMLDRKINDPAFTAAMKNKFLTSYEKRAKIKIDNNVRSRLENYYYWTAMRTVTMFLLQDNAEPERAKPLIEQVAKVFEVKI